MAGDYKKIIFNRALQIYRNQANSLNSNQLRMQKIYNPGFNTIHEQGNGS